MAKRFVFYAMAFFISTTLLAGWVEAFRIRTPSKPAGSTWSTETVRPFDSNLVRFFPHVPVPILSPVGSPNRPAVTLAPQETLEKPQVVVAHHPVTPTHSVARSGDVWACIRNRESGGNYAEDSGNGYYGAYQFSASTWRSVGGSGLPSSASPAEQDYRARLLQQRGGWGQWPSSSRLCGAA